MTLNMDCHRVGSTQSTNNADTQPESLQVLAFRALRARGFAVRVSGYGFGVLEGLGFKVRLRD